MAELPERLQSVADALKGHPDARGYPDDTQRLHDAARFLAMFDVAVDHLFPGGVAEPAAVEEPTEALTLPMACVHAREAQAHDLGFRQGVERGLGVAARYCRAMARQNGSITRESALIACAEFFEREVVRIRCGGAIEVSAGGEPVRATPESVEFVALRDLVALIDGNAGEVTEGIYYSDVLARARTIVTGSPRLTP